MQALTTQSPINREKLTGQNKRLFEYLETGKSIHCMSEERFNLRIGYLNSRCSDLINVHGINLYKRFIQVKDVENNNVTVVEYSLKPFLSTPM